MQKQRDTERIVREAVREHMRKLQADYAALEREIRRYRAMMNGELQHAEQEKPVSHKTGKKRGSYGPTSTWFLKALMSSPKTFEELMRLARREDTQPPHFTGRGYKPIFVRVASARLRALKLGHVQAEGDKLRITGKGHEYVKTHPATDKIVHVHGGAKKSS